MTNVVDILQKRGFIDAVTSDELYRRADSPLRLYCGFDPTADSLHLGNLVAIMGLAWFQRFGHTPVVIVGGATGLIGDPSGKNQERPLLSEEVLEKNLKGISKNLQTILRYGESSNPPLFFNNLQWYKEVSFIEFLHNIGRYFRMGSMLAKDSVKTRLQSDAGMSFTEFTYQILQGFDFLHLYDFHQVELQIGGQDQWGNITAGSELVRRARGASVYGLTFPLLTRSDGKKFGKSEKGAIWLSPERLSPYEFYQHLFRLPDVDIPPLMRLLTFMELEEIDYYKNSMESKSYIPNTLQAKLAEEVTRIVHGEQGVQSALEITKGLAPGSDTLLNASTLEKLSKEVKQISLSLERLIGSKVVDLLVLTALQPSKGQARRLMANGGVYVNNQKVVDVESTICSSMLIDHRFLLLAVGKKNKCIVQVDGSSS